jgi:hypothetical protein
MRTREKPRSRREDLTLVPGRATPRKGEAQLAATRLRRGPMIERLASIVATMLRLHRGRSVG